MASISQGSKKRQAKATQQQIDYMVDYFVQYPHLATGKFNSMHGRADLSGSWEILVAQLNALGKDGKTKDMKSWKSTWRDNKTMVSQKIAKIRTNRAATGNVGGPSLKLTEREEKILRLMGHDYVEGVQCPDSFPEEIPNAMELLLAGQDHILNDEAQPLSLRQQSDAAFTDYETVEGEVQEDLREEEQVPEQFEVAVMHHADMEEPDTLQIQAHLQQFSENSPNAPLAAANTVRRRPRSVRRGCERLNTQLQNARDVFASLTERQVSCMEMFAKAMQKMAENESESNELLRAFVVNQQSREKAFSEMTTMLRDCIEILKHQ